jgi:hypothetical protein
MSNTTNNDGRSETTASYNPKFPIMPWEEYDGCWCIDPSDPIMHPVVEFYTNFPGA